MYLILRKNLTEPTNKMKIMEKFGVTNDEMKLIYTLPFKTTTNSRAQTLRTILRPNW